MSEPSSKPSLFAETPPAPYPANDVLPEYSLAARSAPPRSVACSAEHRATLQTNGRTWLTLLLRSHTAHAGTQPYFLGSTPIKGAVELDLAKPECVQKITVQIFGKIAGRNKKSNSADTFFNTSYLVWEAPSPTARTSSGFLGRLRTQECEKLSAGRHIFDFSLDIPALVKWAGGKQYGLEEFDMPATFVEKGARGSILYELEVRVKRSGTLSIDDLLIQPFSFCPEIRPGPLSDKRRNAYELGQSDVPGLLQDPEGWESGPSVAIQATIFGQREVEAKYTMSLAKPLCYTRGGIIPCELRIVCDDTEALDLLFAPSSPVVKLFCHMQFKSIVKEKQASPSSVVSGVLDSSYYADLRTLQHAVWWTPCRDVKLPSGERRLSGEIHVPPTLKPGMQTPEFEVYYTVALFPPAAPGFVLTGESAQQGGSARMPLHATRIGIASLHPEGVRPLPVTPPSYTQPESWPTLLQFDSAFT